MRVALAVAANTVVRLMCLTIEYWCGQCGRSEETDCDKHLQAADPLTAETYWVLDCYDANCQSSRRRFQAVPESLFVHCSSIPSSLKQISALATSKTASTSIISFRTWRRATFRPLGASGKGEDRRGRGCASTSAISASREFGRCTKLA